MSILSNAVAVDASKRRLVVLVYGKPKIGKTTTVMKLADPDHKQYVYLLDVDKGSRLERDKSPEQYQGHLIVGEPLTMRELREAIAEVAAGVKVLMAPKDVGGKNLPARRVWCVLDSGTILQQSLLVEARRVDVESTGKKRHTVSSDTAFEREMTTGVDYLINLGHMGEIMNALTSLPCNVVIVAHEKGAKEGRNSDKTVYKPDFSGAIYNMVCGRCDCILRMMATPDGQERVFRAHNNLDDESGDRSGKLDEFEPCDLLTLHRKIFPLPPKAAPADQPTGGNSQPVASGEQIG